MGLRQSLILKAVSHNEEQIYVGSAVCKPEAKIALTRKCLCSNSQTVLWELELAQRVDFVELLATKQFIQGYLQHRRRKSCLEVAKVQNIHISLFREAHNVQSFDRKCCKTNTSFTAGSFLETNMHTIREEWVPSGSDLCMLQRARRLS